MARAGRKRDEHAKQRGETEAQWRSRIVRMKQEARNRDEPLVTPEAERHGMYESGFVTNVDDGTKAYTSINRGGSPVARWIAADRLTQTQQAVITLCLHLWRLAGIQQRVTANYGERISGSGNIEVRATNEIEAREDLHRIRAYFPGPLAGYFDVFENIVRHEMPAGVAGSTLGYGNRSAQDRAHQIVCFVADYVAAREGI